MKNLLKHLRTIFSLLFTISALVSCGQITNKELIIGKWQFEKFTSEYEDSKLSDDETQMLRDANKANKSLTVTFTSDNKFRSEQKGGMDVNNSQGKYYLVEKDKVAIMGDTSRILQLDKIYLRLYSKGRPIVTFKRL